MDNSTTQSSRLEPAVRTSLGTNPHISDEILKGSWYYAIAMMSYCVIATLVGVLAVVLLPDPQTLALIRDGGPDQDAMNTATHQVAVAYNTFKGSDTADENTVNVKSPVKHLKGETFSRVQDDDWRNEQNAYNNKISYDSKDYLKQPTNKLQDLNVINQYYNKQYGSYGNKPQDEKISTHGFYKNIPKSTEHSNRKLVSQMMHTLIHNEGARKPTLSHFRTINDESSPFIDNGHQSTSSSKGVGKILESSQLSSYSSYNPSY